MTKMNRTKRLAREIQRQRDIPYTLALREAKEVIAEQHGDDRIEAEQEDSES